MRRSAFTLIELLISVLILSILMLFLYKSYDALNRSNATLNGAVQKLSKELLIKKCIYLDLTTAFGDSINILQQNPQKDILFLQTNNSLHNRINPYVGYIVKDKILYRIESLKPLKEYPLGVDSEFIVDQLAKIEIFRIYKSKNIKESLFLVYILFEDKRELLLKIKNF